MVDIAPTHEVTVTFTVTVPHELSDNEEAVHEVFDEEVAADATLYAMDDDGEDQEITIVVKPGSVKWTEL